MIIKVDDCDILLLYSFRKLKENKTQSINGHLFEMLDYYFLLRKKYKIKCLIVELDKPTLLKICERYYNNININDFIFIDRNKAQKDIKIIKSKNIFLMDGKYDFFKEVMLLGNLLSFGCGCSYFKNNDERPKNVLFLEDHRIYKNKPNSINYVKKILPFKKPNNFKDRTFIHLTGDCRKYNHLELIEKYPNCLIFSDYLEETYNITNKPVNIGDFNKYIYTPISRKFDCSPRLITECDYLGIPVEYYNIDYHDIGLETRKLDIKNKNYLLTEDDEIFNILKENLK